MPEEKTENKITNSYFKNVDKYSDNHLDDILRFSSLLEALKSGKPDAENKKYIEQIENSVSKFNSIISKNKLNLSESELEDINSINNSSASAGIKLRMLEDLLFKIRKNHKEEIHESGAVDHHKEIQEIETKKIFLIEWIHLFIFSMNYHTITPFTHNIKDSSLSIIKNNLHENISNVKEFLKELLDNEYFIFSIVEYNSLALILDLEKSIVELKQYKDDEYYNPEKLKDIMHRFCSVYLKIHSNAAVIDETVKKISEKRKPPHGFYGYVKLILDQPLFNGKTVRLSAEAKINQTVCGTLISYYTSLEKKVFTTLFQIQYHLNINTSVDKNKKNLTGTASIIEKQQHDSEDKNKNSDEKKYNSLREIFDTYLPAGKKISENIVTKENIIGSETWHRNYEHKPMFKPVQLIEALVKHFTERINTPNSIIFRYDNCEFPHFFEHRKEILTAAKGLNTVDLELTATKVKDILDLDAPPDVANENFIVWILNHDKSYFSNLDNYTQAKTFIINIQSKVFSLASVVQSIIEKYESQKEINFQLAEENYNFFINAEIAAHRQLVLNKITDTDPVTAEIFLKALCALCFFIAEVFGSPALTELKTEKERLDKIFKENTDDIKVENTSNVYVKKVIPSFSESEHIDALTGIFKFQYFTDVLKPQQYNDSSRYNLDEIRFQFFIEIQNFQEINNRMGHDTGDQLLSKCCKILIEMTNHSENISLFKYKNANIFGIFSTSHSSEVADYIKSCAEIINKLSAVTSQYALKNIFINCGIYEERKESVFTSTFEITRRLMHSGTNVNANNIVQIKNRDLKISKRDFLHDGSINSKILKITH